MNHSLIPLLKFHPVQPWPHREKEGYWGAKWDKGPRDRAHQSIPCQSRFSRRNDSPPLSFLPSYPSPLTPPLFTASLEDLVIQIQCSRQKKSACSERSIMEGLPERRGLEVVTDALPFFSLWPNAGKGWGLALDCSPLFSPTPKSPHLGICWTSCTETTACTGTDWVLGSTQVSMHGRQWKESSISFQPTQFHNYYWK